MSTQPLKMPQKKPAEMSQKSRLQVCSVVGAWPVPVTNLSTLSFSFCGVRTVYEWRVRRRDTKISPCLSGSYTPATHRYKVITHRYTHSPLHSLTATLIHCYTHSPLHSPLLSYIVTPIHRYTHRYTHSPLHSLTATLTTATLTHRYTHPPLHSLTATFTPLHSSTATLTATLIPLHSHRYTHS
ncbi:hypothetical protein O3P69_003414 [Scylla paramamosain]|uniref:Uncharacterized protein n=1 Tax=Scylla paramamosain TaxID=85552 RepID=A0AAW0UGJ6_SCYPA